MTELRDHRRERLIEDDLRRLPRDRTPSVDVRRRVLARIAGLRPERPLRSTWLALAASVALAACLGWANATTLPHLPSALRDVASATSAPRTAFAGLAFSTATATLATLTEALSRSMGLVVAVFELLERYAWAWKPCLAAGLAIACIVAGAVLLREFKKAPRVNSIEETRHDA